MLIYLAAPIETDTDGLGASLRNLAQMVNAPGVVFYNPLTAFYGFKRDAAEFQETRKANRAMIKVCDAVFCVPGGFETIREIEYALTCCGKPVVCFKAGTTLSLGTSDLVRYRDLSVKLMHDAIVRIRRREHVSGTCTNWYADDSVSE